MSDRKVGQIRKRARVWSLWAKALGEKASHKKHEADFVALIRTLIFLSYLTTNGFIIAGVVRHWNDYDLQKFTPDHNRNVHYQNSDVCHR
jgi:hypothetical protein